MDTIWYQLSDEAAEIIRWLVGFRDQAIINMNAAKATRKSTSGVDIKHKERLARYLDRCLHHFSYCLRPGAGHGFQRNSPQEPWLLQEAQLSDPIKELWKIHQEQGDVARWDIALGTPMPEFGVDEALGSGSGDIPDQRKIKGTKGQWHLSLHVGYLTSTHPS